MLFRFAKPSNFYPAVVPNEPDYREQRHNRAQEKQHPPTGQHDVEKVEFYSRAIELFPVVVDAPKHLFIFLVIELLEITVTFFQSRASRFVQKSLVFGCFNCSDCPVADAHDPANQA